MNTKKQRRRAAPKLTQKVDRGGQNRRVVEGKSNIAAKRVTLLPGFLINGFTSNTAQKTKAPDDIKPKKNHLLTGNLQAYLEQKGNHLRRSQRILKKHFDQQTTNGSKASSGNHCDNLMPTPSQGVNPNVSFRSMPKYNSKSLFKDISDRFSKVNINNIEEVSQKPSVHIKENRHGNQNFDYLEEIGHRSMTENAQFSDKNVQNVNEDHQNLNQNPRFSNQECQKLYGNRQNLIQNGQYMDRNHFEEVPPPEPNEVFRIEVNRSFCRNLEKQISVTFKRNIVNECREKIMKEMDIVDLVLQGKVEVEMAGHDHDGDRSGAEDSDDGPALKFYPVPPQSWVYRTPINQKIGAPRMEESQLQTGVMCQNQNQRNLYEVKPSFKVNFSNLRNADVVPIDDRFMRKVAEVRRTPANFEFRGYSSDGGPNIFQQPWRVPVGCGGSAELCVQEDAFIKPNSVNIITRPVNLPRKPVFPNYLEDNMPTPKILPETNSQNFSALQDFTFIEDGNDFKVQESQPVAEQRNKRKLDDDDEEFVIKRRHQFVTDPLSCVKNMFNFGSQERNMFNFGKV